MASTSSDTFRQRLRDPVSALTRSFRNRSLRRLQLAWLGSVLGNWSYLVAVSVYAWGQGGPRAVGLVWVIRLVPAAILSPLLATVADRYRRERVMVVSDLARAALMGVGAVLIATGAPAWTVYATIVAATIVGVVFRPAQAALLPRLARDPAELTAANVASSTIESVATFIGPALGGLILAATGPDVVFAANGATFVWSAALVLGIKAPGGRDARRTSPRDRSFMGEIWGGVHAIVGEGRVAIVTGLYAVQTLVAGVTNVLVVVVAFDILDVGEAGVGYLNAALGAGGIVGGFVALVLAARGRLAGDFAIGLVLCGLPLVAVGLVADVPVALLAMAAIGLGNAVVDVAALTLLQRIVGDDVLGRVLGTLEGILLAAIGVGALLAPVLVDVAGPETALVIAGLVLPAVTLIAADALRLIDRAAAPPAQTDLLRGVPFLASLPEAVLEHLARTLGEVRVAPGEVVVRQGEPGERFYVIDEGEVEIEGRRFGPGAFFGEIALLHDVPRTATVTAVSAGLLRTLERHEFLAAVTGHEPTRASAEEVATARLAGLAGGAGVS
jgi:MFS family permease